MIRPAGRFALVLHSHLPYVLRHGRWPHGTDWLCEAVAESYLPLLRSLERLERDGVPARLTISFTPVLAEQLADEGFREEFRAWIAGRRTQLERDTKDAGQSDARAADLVHTWKGWLDETERHFNALDGQLLRAFRELEERGRVELTTSAATHGYLPLLSLDASVELQLRTAKAAHRRHFGRDPRGIWLPECAYRPRYEWTPPIGRDAGRIRSLRLGLEEMVARHGIRWFTVDSHVALAGDPLSIYRNFYPSLAALRGYEERFPQQPRMRSSGRSYRVRSKGAERQAVALVRDARSSLQVWSRDEGYPGHPDYLDFHRRNVANGLRYFRVTGAGVAEKDKQLYDVGAAERRTEEHARHFVWLLGDTLERMRSSGIADPLIVSPFDTELFGHWWFEGPLFLEHVFRHLADSGITAATGSDEADSERARDEVSLLEGSWGEGGDHRAWLNKHTEWTWDRVYDAEGDVAATLAQIAKRGGTPPAPVDRALRQALRELMLLQSSDWQFLITTGAARDYAERRFATHYVELKRLLDLARRTLAGAPPDEEDDLYLSVMEKRDRCFPDVDASWFASPR